MTDYLRGIQTNTRKCSISGRELQPGEKYFSVLFDENGAFVRRDFSAESWSGAPEGAYSFWSGRLPLEANARRPPIDDEMLFDCLRRMDGEIEPAKIKFRLSVVAFSSARAKPLEVRGNSPRRRCRDLLVCPANAAEGRAGNGNRPAVVR